MTHQAEQRLAVRIRDRGLGALKEPLNAARIGRLNPAERAALNVEIHQVIAARREAPQPSASQLVRPRRRRR